ncbi:globin domain-containing protein [Streptomyces rhizosphaerihabitans]|uniref:globin domain-containing protein n=1 Tax=Streptomyces rhizosphaerihabitans TaxID=1266770 RepID=UPI0028F6F6A9|nr:globin domain-containing protein [Streptomyces rhizosphaerihabitans]
MDAPTTTSADNGTSGGNDGGGWFTPHNEPPTSVGDQGPSDGRRLAAMRPVGRSVTAQGQPGQAVPERAASGQGTPEQAGQRTSQQERISPVAEAPMAPRGAVPVPHGTAPTETGTRGTTSREIRPYEAAPPGMRPPEPLPNEPVLPVTRFLPPAPSEMRHFEPEPAHEAVRPRSSPGQTEFGSLRLSGASAPEYRSPQSHHGPPRPDVGPEPLVTGRQPVPAPEASPDAVLIRRTMAEVAHIADKVTSYFYALLFVRHPELRPLFPAAMDAQRDRLLKALLTAAEHIDNTEVLVAYLQNLGRGHRKYGTRPEHYPAVGECLIGSLGRYASAVWDAETEAAWVRTYTTISQVMIDAAAADELRAPAWWFAEVVSHDLRTPDVAVVTLRPDQPYPFLAGQYTSLETPWWPRIWRHYSFASAPRSDGLLTLHVKAVPAGWVSNALVHRARPGDVIRLGPPSGSMTVDHTTDSGLLCLGGGTGIAPIKALVEDVAEHGERRPVEVFYGARTDHDLYDIDTMLRLQRSHPWLSVRPVVDRRAHLQLPDAVREYGPWNEYDAYLSGPPGMIRSAVDALRDIGIPSDRIRHDSVEELVTTGD